MSKGIQVTFDAADPHALARWRADLPGYQLAGSHELAGRLRTGGVITDAGTVPGEGRLFLADAVAASDPDGSGPRLYFQRVPEPKTARHRVHLDVLVRRDQLDGEVSRLCASGATLSGCNIDPGHRAAVMRDPEGNEFCLH
jgi:hypothetical protein